jgi:hypothetical protein
MRARFLICCAIIILIPLAAQALTLEELKRYSKDGKVLTPGEYKIYRAHQDDPLLAKYDTNNDGWLSPEEFRKLQADIAKRYGNRKRPADKDKLKPEDLFARGRNAYEAANGGIPLADLAEKPKKTPDACKPGQNIYIRHDQLDSYLYGITPVAKAKGASVSFTDDHVAKQRSLTVDGVVAYVLARDACLPRPPRATIDDAYLSAYAIAPWVEVHGTLNDPVKKTEKSSLKTGFNTEFTIFGGGIFNYQAFIIAPYLQTDFRGVAQIGGLTAAWEPVQYFVRLGGSPTLLSEYFDWYWQLRAEADIKQVDTVGFTGLQLGRYAWLGTTTRINGFFFPTSTNVPEFLQNRLHAIATYQAYWDANTSAKISQYSIELAYNLTDDGGSSVSVEYKRGTTKDTLEFVNQYLVKLNYKY